LPEPLIWPIDAAAPAPDVLARAAALLAEGAVVAYPTETLYGLAVDAANHRALARLAALKKRPDDKPFPLIIGAEGQIAPLAAALTPLARRLMAAHWPGPLTIVLAAAPGLPPELTHQGGVALRLSSHPVAAGLALALGRAVTATSANLAGRPAPAGPEALDPALLARIDLLLDGGPCPGGAPSTIVLASGRRAKVLRQGAVALAEQER